MKDTLLFLTQIKPPRNYKNIESLNRVAEYIYMRFLDLGLEVRFQEFIVNGKTFKNVIASLNSQHSQLLVIGGHYDVCGDIQGADDNASAIAGLVECAKYLKKYEQELCVRIDFIAFCLEEPPFFGTEHMGSAIHAKFLHENNIPLIGMINFEMIGYFSDQPHSQEYPLEFMKNIYPDKGNFIALITNEASQNFLHDLSSDTHKTLLPIVSITLPEDMANLTASDHLNYWHYGYPAIMVTDTAYFRNKNYHKISDTLETLDLEKMYLVVEIIAQKIITFSLKKKMLHHIKQAQLLVQQADAILITAGAGMGVDSGLPDFRGDKGFWKAYPPLQEKGLHFYEIAVPHWFQSNPSLAWAFYGHRLDLYKKISPHDGFILLRELVKKKQDNYFIYTSNVDGHFQKAGFSEEKIIEVHGSIHHFQCSKNCTPTIWSAGDTHVEVDMATFTTQTIPLCPYCNAVARPNIMMFDDFHWNNRRYYQQQNFYRQWLAENKNSNILVIEIGAGMTIPTVRWESEKIVKQFNISNLIRINPYEYEINLKKGISIPMGGYKGILEILK